MAQKKQRPSFRKPGKDCKLPPERRIRTRNQIQFVQGKGRKLYSRHFLIIAHPTDGPTSRIAVTITKKVDKRAVARNRIKRKVKEVFRLYREKLVQSFDILVIARKNAGEVDFENVRREILGALHHNGLL